jgi:protein-tyrosine phosphatase
MYDIHCHILPGLDDGPKTLEESLAMAEEAVADGITHVVGTPHASSTYAFDFRKVRAARDELQEKLGDRLIVATGCDFHFSPENIEALRQDGARFCVNQKDYLLVEFNEFSIPPWMDQTLHELQLAGIRPIVTHPERNGILRTQPERLVKWVRQGCFVQVTAGSLAGVFGPSAREVVWKWIGKGLIHFVSSDAHNTARRPLKLKFAFDDVKTHFGVEKAEGLFIHNPRAAFDGETLPYVPEIPSEDEGRKKKRFIFF